MQLILFMGYLVKMLDYDRDSSGDKTTEKMMDEKMMDESSRM